MSATSATAIDLSRLPAPEIVELLDYEVIRAALLADMLARYPDFSLYRLLFQYNAGGTCLLAR